MHDGEGTGVTESLHIASSSMKKIKVQKMLKLRRTATTKKIPDEIEDEDSDK